VHTCWDEGGAFELFGELFGGMEAGAVDEVVVDDDVLADED
jgi:hypothetical protein